MNRGQGTELIERYKRLFDQKGDLIELKDRFLHDLPEDFEGDSIFQDIIDYGTGEDLPELCAEFIISVAGVCDEDDFHNWNYDHLEFIIELSNTYGFDLPANFLNGLPEQLILLVDSKKIRKKGC